MSKSANIVIANTQISSITYMIYIGRCGIRLEWMWDMLATYAATYIPNKVGDKRHKGAYLFLPLLSFYQAHQLMLEMVQ